MKRIILGCIALTLLLASIGTVAAKENYIHLIGPTGTPRAAHTATLLPDGTVFIAGGMQKDGVSTATTTLYNDTGTTFISAEPMNVARAGHTATLMNDGGVLFLGGYDSGAPVALAEMYDSTQRAWTSIGDAPVSGGGFTATLLLDGRVLIVGGVDDTVSAAAYLFDPETREFTATGSLNVARASHTATLLDDGSVLVAGGTDGADVLASAELFDPATGTFSVTGSLHTARTMHGAALMADGRVFVGGGSDMRGWDGRLASVELYDPELGEFVQASDMINVRYQLAGAVTALGNGNVLIAGGGAPEVYDAATSTFLEVPGGFTTGRQYSTATLLPDGDVFIVGGANQSQLIVDLAWVYLPTHETF